MEFERKDNQMKKFENQIREITQLHQTQAQSIPQWQEHRQLIEPFENSTMVKSRRTQGETNRDKDSMNREYIEERRDSIAKYIATLYLEAR